MNKEIIERNIFTILEQIDKETFKIFRIVTSEKDISVYKYILLKTKLELLSSKLDTSLLSLLENETNKINRFRRLRIITIILNVLCIIVCIINPLLGLSTVLLNNMNYKLVSNRMKQELIDFDTLENIEERMHSLRIQFDNCENFLEANTNLEIENREEELNDEELNMIDLCGEKFKLEFANEDILDNEMVLKRTKNKKN